MEEDISLVLEKLAAESDVIIGDPETIKYLKDEEVRIEGIINNVSPAILSIYNEIIQCMHFGLHGAAITLSSILVEFTLKYATYITEMGGFKNYNTEKWDEFENIAFDAAIKRAVKAGLINKEQKIKLKSFKDTIRNPYSHYNIRKITKSVIWENVKVLNIESKRIDIMNIAAEDNPVIQAQAKPCVDRYLVSKVFSFADRIVTHLLRKINLG